MKMRLCFCGLLLPILVFLVSCAKPEPDGQVVVPPSEVSPGIAEQEQTPQEPASRDESITSAPQDEQQSGNPDISGNPDKPDEPETPAVVSGEVLVTLDYTRQSGSASNQFAVWIEDMGGNLVKTLYVTQWTATGGYVTRPDSVALWVSKSGLEEMQKSDVDAVSGATPRAGAQSYTWDLTDLDDEKVPPGEYVFVVEGTLRWKNYVVFSGVIDVGGATSTVQANATFTYEGSDRYAELNSDSPENVMIGNVVASFVPK